MQEVAYWRMMDIDESGKDGVKSGKLGIKVAYRKKETNRGKILECSTLKFALPLKTNL